MSNPQLILRTISEFLADNRGEYTSIYSSFSVLNALQINKNVVSYSQILILYIYIVILPKSQEKIVNFTNMVGKYLSLVYAELRKKNIVMSKKEFCSKIGIEYTNYSKYVNGSLNFEINNKNYYKIKSLNINYEWLFTGKGKMFLVDKDKASISLSEAIPLIKKIAKSDNIERRLIEYILDANICTKDKLKLEELIINFINNPIS